MSYRNLIDNIQEYLINNYQWYEYFEESKAFYYAQMSKGLNISEKKFMKLIGTQPNAGNIFGIIFETFFDKEYGDSHENLLDSYVKKYRWRIPRDEKKILDELRSKPFSIYEVLEVNLGESLIIQDILRNSEEIKVYEKMGTNFIKPFNFIVAKVIEENGVTGFTGSLSIIGSQNAKRIQIGVKNLLENTSKEINQILRDFTPEMLTCAAIYMLSPTKHITYEGDELEPMEITFKVKNRKKLIKKLDYHDELYIAAEEPDNPFWNWAVYKDKLEQTKNMGEHYLLVSTFLGEETDLIVMGNIELIGNELFCTTLSNPRTDKLVKLLQDCLGDLIDKPIIKSTPLKPKNKNSKTQIEEDDELTEEDIAYAMKSFENFCRESLDEKIGILNNQTPRECAQTDPIRVKRWLKKLETTKPIKDVDIDLDWMWQELGVER
jgi:hypothetical protein